MKDVGEYEIGVDMAISEPDSSNTITFSLKGGEEVIRMVPGKFFYRGEEVEDAQKVYEAFCEWLVSARG